jgi:G3E family GTPase
MTAARVPVTVLTGFLGSGKTTLLNRILKEHHGQRIAVIENELGEIGVDQALVIDAEEEIFELSNGCICCRVRGDLIRILGSLMQRRDRFDRILIETTGLANPGPVAQTFFIDPEIKEQLALDGIVTLVDARHVLQHLGTGSECQEQIAFADVIVLNKIDLVGAAELSALEARIRRLNPGARLHRSERANVDLKAVLEVGGFDLSRALSEKPSFLEPEYPFEWTGVYALEPGVHQVQVRGGLDPSADLVLVRASGAGEAELREAAERSVRVASLPAAGGGTRLSPESHTGVPLGAAATVAVPISEPGLYALSTEHLPEEFAFALASPAGERLVPRAARAWKPAHEHEAQVGSIGIRSQRAVDLDRFQSWLGALLQRRGPALYRGKGVLSVAGSDRRWVFHSVHMLLESANDRAWGPTEPRESLLVFIGKGLDERELRDGFESCLR